MRLGPYGAAHAHARIPKLVDSYIRYVILMPGSSRELIRQLQAAGWRLVRTRGSHWQFKHPSRPGLITVPHPKRDLPTGTWHAITRAAGLIGDPPASAS